MVGLVGYPNVGKSSTINAIFGAKKTAVAPTPGKTKHFQTLNVSPTLCLCDCPGELLCVLYGGWYVMLLCWTSAGHWGKCWTLGAVFQVSDEPVA
jgi:large subunit GTPase 1